MNLTYGIRYAGSKAKILNKISDMIVDLPVKKVLDGFSGSTRVSQLFKQLGYTTYSNDKAIYSRILAETFLINKKEKSYYIDIISHLNNLKGKDGWFSKHYGGNENNGLSIQSDGLKKPFQIHNTRKLDAVREEIDKIYKNDSVEKSVILTSLILALDKVQNDLGHQVSYLKNWSSKSYNTFEMTVPDFEIDNLNHKVYNKNIFEIKDSFDLIYFDPPYGTSNLTTPTSRVRYGSYYHLWTTIILNDKPLLFGKAKRREDVSSDNKEGAVSVFESTNKEIVKNGFKKLFDMNSNYYLLSYSNRSKLNINEIINLTNHLELVKLIQFPHKENSQAKTIINNKYTILHDEENMEILLLLKRKI